MSDALTKHHYDWEGDTAETFFDTPAVEQHRGGDGDAHEWESGAETIFWDAGSPLFGPFYGDIIRIATAEERTKDIATSWSEIEKPGLDGGGEVEAWVEDVADWCEEGVHIPD